MRSTTLRFSAISTVLTLASTSSGAALQDFGEFSRRQQEQQSQQQSQQLEQVQEKTAPAPTPAAQQAGALTPEQQKALEQQVQTQAADILKSIQDYCHYNAEEKNPKKIRKTNACINNSIRIHQQRVRLNQSLQNAAQNEAMMNTLAKQGLPVSLPTKLPTAGLTGGGGAAGGAGAGGGKEAAGSGPNQPFVGGSLSGTPSTCGTGSGFNSPLIRVHRVVMTPNVASDDFGHRLGRRFVVYQVTVENGSKDFQFMLQDVTVDFSRQFNQLPGTYFYNASSQDLTLLRGVPEKGEDLDPRNLTLHVLQGIGSVAGAVSGLTTFADVMGPAVAVFNGAFLQGYTTIAPDHTSTQLNRLSDSAFMANTVVDKQRARTIAMFIPADEILSQADQKDFRKDPNAFLGFTDAGILNQADVCVDGTFIQAVTGAVPTLTSATLPSTLAPAPNQDITLTINGGNMVAGDTEVVVGATTPATAIVITADGKTGSAQVHLPSDFVLGTTTATLRSRSNISLTSGAGVKITLSATTAPTLISATVPKDSSAGQKVTITVVGSDIVSGDTQVVVGGAAPVAEVLTTSDGKNATAQITLPADFDPNTTTVTLRSKGTPTLTSGAGAKITIAP